MFLCTDINAINFLITKQQYTVSVLIVISGNFALILAQRKEVICNLCLFSDKDVDYWPHERRKNKDQFTDNILLLITVVNFNINKYISLTILIAETLVFS